MNTIILANKREENLYPLLADKPKALAKILNKPCIDYLLDLLFLQGIENCALILNKEDKETKEHLLLGEYKENLKIMYEYNLEESFFEDNLLLIENLPLCDFDFSLPLDFHKRKKALVTVITLENQPMERGWVVESDKHQKVFTLTNTPTQPFSFANKVNTGFYIVDKKALKLLNLDFIKESIIKLIEQGESIYEYTIKGFFNSLETPEDYKKANLSLLTGQVMSLSALPKRGRYNFKTMAPLYIGSGCNADSSAFAGPNAVVGNNCIVDKNAILKDCVVGDNVFIGEGAFVRGIVGDNAVISPYATVERGAVVGCGAKVGKNSRILEGSRVYPGCVVGSGLKVGINVKEKGKGLFEENIIEGDIRFLMSPVFSARLGTALANVFKDEVMVGYNCQSPFLESFVAGLGAKGVFVLKTKECINPVKYAAVKNSLPLIYFYFEENTVKAYFYNVDGSPLTYIQKQQIEKAFFKEEESFCPYTLQKSPHNVNLGSAYKNLVLKVLDSAKKNLFVYGQKELCNLFSNCVNETNAGELEIELMGNGVDLAVIQGGERANTLEISLILCLFENTKKLPLPLNIPQYLLSRIGVERVFAKNIYETHPYYFDNILMAARLLNIMDKTSLSLLELKKALPSFGVSTGKVAVKKKEELILNLRELVPCSVLKERGITIFADNGVVDILPMSLEESFKIYAYAVSSESSKELCEDLCDIIKSIDIK